MNLPSINKGGTCTHTSTPTAHSGRDCSVIMMFFEEFLGWLEHLKCWLRRIYSWLFVLVSLSHGPSLTECQHFLLLLLLLSRRRRRCRAQILFHRPVSSRSFPCLALPPSSFCQLKLFRLVCNLDGVFFCCCWFPVPFLPPFSASSSSPNSCRLREHACSESRVSRIKTARLSVFFLGFVCAGKHLKWSWMNNLIK